MSLSNPSHHDALSINQALTLLIDQQSLSITQMYDVMLTVMQGNASESQIAALMVALRMKGETASELEGAVRAMRHLMTPVALTNAAQAIDIVGTGGDGAHLINISTASALVAAAAGAVVAKHGSRSVSSKSGSADLLEAAGLRLDLDSDQVARCVDSLAIGFMFAIQHHPAMRFAAAPRKALGMRSIFNLLGPMTNPANVQRHMIGAYDVRWCEPMAQVLANLGSTHALIVNGFGSLDELSLAGTNHVVELQGGEITAFSLRPEDVGLQTQVIDLLKVNDAQSSLVLLKDALGKQRTEAGKVAAEMIAFNAGAALYVAGQTHNIAQGVALAQDIIYGGRALEKLNMLAEFTQAL